MSPQQTPTVNPAPADDTERQGLEDRIERLEKRLEETIGGVTGTHPVRVNQDIDHSEVGDPLRKAVDRARDKRETDK